MERRDFLKLSMGGLATIVVGSRLPWLRAGWAFAAETQTLTITITDMIKGMVTHQDPALFAELGLSGAPNLAECYFWTYQISVGGTAIPVENPGPTIVAAKGDTIDLTITNALDEPHAFFIPGIYDSGPIAPGATVAGSFQANQLGAFLYYDNLNAPVNRVMGLHGALVVMPDPASPPGGGNNFTPYDNPTEAVQRLYDDFGSAEHFPGLAWHEGDDRDWIWDPARGGDPDNPGYREATAAEVLAGRTVKNCPPFRTYVWITHQASPNLFEKVGSLPAGQLYDPAEFMQRFLRSPFSHNRQNDNPEFFTINGQSGFFGHFSPTITPQGRIGEPVVVHILNAGLWTHAMHLHANHFYVTSKNGVVQENPLWLDTFNIEPMDRVDYSIPFMRPPSIPNLRGIGLPDEGRRRRRRGQPEDPAAPPVWPPIEEFTLYFPEPGQDVAERIDGTSIDLKQRQSPLCYPMHDHSEPSQTAQGGNYNCGLISGIYFTGDRNTPGFMDFPMDEDFEMMYRNIRGMSETGPAPGIEPDMTGHTV
ncbi:MAG: multicopper oxidase domain-containing protein [Deltaproteobacteria bacterium]|nr:multicopper oxidase domain-containing protein [Deltaproteobacteria bacterium]